MDHEEKVKKEILEKEPKFEFEVPQEYEADKIDNLIKESPSR